MCFAAMAEEDLKKLARFSTPGSVEVAAYEELMRRRLNDTRIRFPRALEANFEHPATDAEQRIAALIVQHRSAQRTGLEQGMFQQRTRLVEAERALAVRETRKALNEQRIAGSKVEWHRAQLANLERREPRPTDSRIYPFWYTSVIAGVNGERAVMPMRYHCRPCNMPASIDRKFDGLYNARRDNLEGFWKNLFGRRHAILPAWAFYENVALEDFEHRSLHAGEKSKNLVLEFKPQSPHPMLFACIWDKWEAPGEPELYSFAVITDEPPAEVAATGHDRCPIPIKHENVAAWLSPQERSKEELQTILEDRERPYYEHRMAA
ncbi:MAG: SOS response-associated peptidase family protein [Candidatus Parcubacteria bacterium]|nr:SOS response-associated peptidase family protein [Burkholderiales bacterium]